jgi:hypothetical protein
MKHTPKNQHREWDAEARSGQTGKHVRDEAEPIPPTPNIANNPDGSYANA